MKNMKLKINSKERLFEAPLDVRKLLEILDMEEGRVAVELNREILPRERFSETALSDGDCLEIVQFVGGG